MKTTIIIATTVLLGACASGRSGDEDFFESPGELSGTDEDPEDEDEELLGTGEDPEDEDEELSGDGSGGVVLPRPLCSYPPPGGVELCFEDGCATIEASTPDHIAWCRTHGLAPEECPSEKTFLWCADDAMFCTRNPSAPIEPPYAVDDPAWICVMGVCEDAICVLDPV